MIFFIIIIDEICPLYCKVCFDIFKERIIYGREIPNFKCRHDFVKEVFVNILNDPQEVRLTLRFVDFLNTMDRRETCMYI